MKSKFLSFLCFGLLLSAAYDNVLAAMKPDLDDEIATAADNHYISCEPLILRMHDEMHRAMTTALFQPAMLGARAQNFSSTCTPNSQSRDFPERISVFMPLLL